MITYNFVENQDILLDKNILLKAGFKPGQKLSIIYKMGRIEIIPLKKMKSLKGFLKGIDTTIIREDDRI